MTDGSTRISIKKIKKVPSIKLYELIDVVTEYLRDKHSIIITSTQFNGDSYGTEVTMYENTTERTSLSFTIFQVGARSSNANLGNQPFSIEINRYTDGIKTLVADVVIKPLPDKEVDVIPVIRREGATAFCKD